MFYPLLWPLKVFLNSVQCSHPGFTNLFRSIICRNLSIAIKNDKSGSSFKCPRILSQIVTLSWFFDASVTINRQTCQTLVYILDLGTECLHACSCAVQLYLQTIVIVDSCRYLAVNSCLGGALVYHEERKRVLLHCLVIGKISEVVLFIDVI